jgi:hypothetical protein
LAELRAAGDQREVVFAVNVVITGVVQHGEARDPAALPSAPSFSSPEDVAVRPPLPSPVARATAGKQNESALSFSEDVSPQPPVIESYICVQTRQCRDDDDAGEICEGWFSVDDAGQVMVTNKAGKYVGSRAMLEGEDARVVAKQLLREKTPEAGDFNRRLDYPNVGLA